MTSEPTVFVVDDDQAVRNGLSLLIKSVGLNVETYGSAEEFLDACRPSRSGCLVLDVRMPGMSGLELQDRLSARQMMRVLEVFEPNFVLLRQQGRDFYKTGNLNGINTRAGYIASKDGGKYRYVIMINTPGKSTRPIMRRLLKVLD